MEKFANNISVFNFIGIYLLCFYQAARRCKISGYISRVDHPYDKKFYAGFEKVVSTTVYVLKKKGWAIDSEADPSIYERDDRYDNNGYQNLLIITGVEKELFKFDLHAFKCFDPFYWECLRCGGPL